MPNHETSCEIVVLMPVFNDSTAFSWVVREIDAALTTITANVIVVGVDDGSFEPLAFDGSGWHGKCIQEIRCVRLRGNMGHQSAIAIGLSYVYEHIACDAVVVMDADGEDKPVDAARLVEHFRKSDGTSLIFAERIRRSEGLLFQIFYNLYRVLSRILTGHRVRVGNFSIIPACLLERLVVSPNLWIHYAASTFHAGVPRDYVSTNRGQRQEGQSTMNFVSLVTHGLSAISVFGATVGVRLTIGCVLISILGFFSWAGYFYLWIGDNQARLETFFVGVGLSILFASQLFIASIAFVFFILDNRSKANFIPLRDHAFFIGDVRQLYPTRV